VLVLNRRRSAAGGGGGGGGAPLGLTNIANTTITSPGGGVSRITKTGGADGVWDAEVNGTTTLSGDFIIRYTPRQNNLYTSAGVSVNPAQTPNYWGYDFGIFFQNNGQAAYIVSGVVNTDHPYSAGDNWFIKRSGTNLDIGYGGTDGVAGYTSLTVRAGTTGTFVFDSCFYGAGSAIDVIRLS
jgi:hypothetical protein